MPTVAPIGYEHKLMLASQVGPAGLPDGELPALRRRLVEVKASLAEQKKNGDVGFFGIPDRTAEMKAAVALAKSVSREFKTLVVLGIGGSDLGARALVTALKTAGKGMDVRFAGGNTDPEELAALIASLDFRRTAIDVISKSGDTVEPMAAFLIMRERLIAKVGRKRHARHVICTTDEHGGTLREIADREGYRTLPVPRDIGGRYSALTSVGLFPAACAGIDPQRLLAGAAAVSRDFWASGSATPAPLLFAGLTHDAYQKRGQRITVLMPYAESLREFAFWFRQLWAESLGKTHDRHDNAVHAGPTPVAALGATDQHSQIQLYNEGPADKTVTFIEVRKFRADLKVPKAFPDIAGVAYLGGHALSRILHAEREATAQGLAQHGRPSGVITIPAVTPEAVGGLMMFFMLATAAAAELFDVNAYDQPGVEAGKRAMYAALGRPA